MKTQTQTLTPAITEAVKCWTISKVMESYGSNDTSDPTYQRAYNAECRLFNELFPSFTQDEVNTYREFVTWLDNTRMWEADPTIAELFEIFIECQEPSKVTKFLALQKKVNLQIEECSEANPNDVMELESLGDSLSNDEIDEACRIWAVENC